ncbi:MAG: lamin tail domain-containing protein [Pseudomonadota bacterium]
MNKFYLLILITMMSIYSHAHSANLQAGDLIISEIMSNPAAVSDTNGEWFEIFNASASTHDLNGLILSDEGSNSHAIDNTGSLFINPGEYLLLGRNPDSSFNGGLNLDYAYSNFTLSNSTDQIILLFDSVEIARLDYNGAPFGIAGSSAEIIAQKSISNETDYQAVDILQYGDGDFGTPGTAGSFELVSGASNVPLPGALWLFASVSLIGLRALKFKSSVS